MATKEKGKIEIEAMVRGINGEINLLRKTRIPVLPVFQNKEALTGSYYLSKNEKGYYLDRRQPTDV